MRTNTGPNPSSHHRAFLPAARPMFDAAGRPRFDACAVIPSTEPAARAIHPLNGVIARTESLTKKPPIVTGSWPEAFTPGQSADDVFLVNPMTPVDDKAILFIDDSLTTGAHVQS